MKFAKVTQRCLGCRASLPSNDESAALCPSCKPNEAEVYLTKLQHLAHCERMFWLTSVQCQRITGHNYADVTGIARDSPIYYQTIKARKDLKEARETVGRFGDPVGVC